MMAGKVGDAIESVVSCKQSAAECGNLLTRGETASQNKPPNDMPNRRITYIYPPINGFGC